MSKIIKIQQDVIKAERPSYCVIPDGVALTADGYMCVIVPLKSCRIDYGKLERAFPVQIIKDSEKAIPATKTNNLKKDSVRTSICFKTDTFEIWVNEKYLKYFDKAATAKATERVLYLYEANRLAGLIMGVKIKENNT